MQVLSFWALTEALRVAFASLSAIDYIDCSTGVVKTQCGNEISTVTKGLLLELFEKADAANDDVDCHSLSKSYCD